MEGSDFKHEILRHGQKLKGIKKTGNVQEWKWKQ